MRHATWYAGLAEQVDQQLRGHGQQRWLARLDAASAKPVSAGLAVAQSDAALALRLAGALAWYWFLRGWHGEGRW